MISYGILFYLITLFIVSNIIFTVGTFMNERFIYMPSVGFVLIVAWFFASRLPKLLKNKTQYQYVAITFLILILSLYTVKTIARNKVWQDDFTLFTTDVKTSVNSTKCNTSAGGKYMERARNEQDTALKNKDFRTSLLYLNRAIQIYPGNKNCLLLMGNVYALYRNDYKGAIDLFLKVLHLDGYNEIAYNNILSVLGSMDNAKETDYKIGVCGELLKVNPDNGTLNYFLGQLYGQVKGNIDTAEYFFTRSAALSPEKAEPYKDLGVIYGMKKEYDKAIRVLKKAAELDPKDLQVQQNLATTYKLIGQSKNRDSKSSGK